MGINRFDVYGSGSATATDLQLDSARRELGERVKSVTITGNADVSSTSKFQLVGNTTSAFSTGVDAIVSDNAGDSGIFFISGLNPVGTEVNEFATLNGTTPVTLTNSYIWINVCQLSDGLLNNGTIQLTNGGLNTFTINPKTGNLMTGGQICLHGSIYQHKCCQNIRKVK